MTAARCWSSFRPSRRSASHSRGGAGDQPAGGGQVLGKAGLSGPLDKWRAVSTQCGRGWPGDCRRPDQLLQEERRVQMRVHFEGELLEGEAAGLILGLGRAYRPARFQFLLGG